MIVKLFQKNIMSVTLEIPPNILENANKYAASEGISLDALIARLLESTAKELLQTALPDEKKNPLGRFRGTVLYMADDFNEPLEDFKEYME